MKRVKYFAHHTNGFRDGKLASLYHANASLFSSLVDTFPLVIDEKPVSLFSSSVDTFPLVIDGKLNSLFSSSVDTFPLVIDGKLVSLFSSSVDTSPPVIDGSNPNLIGCQTSLILSFFRNAIRKTNQIETYSILD